MPRNEEAYILELYASVQKIAQENGMKLTRKASNIENPFTVTFGESSVWFDSLREAFAFIKGYRACYLRLSVRGSKGIK